MELIDITVTLREGMPHWPGSCGFNRKLVSDLARGDFCNGSEINMDVHVGTHVDA
ncbi:MAG: cyclase family protein, partial [Terriglobales bacterium]